MIFGELTVKQNIKGNLWLCECSCKKTKEVSKSRLTRGVVKSCGCLKNKPCINKDLTGKQFDLLTVIEYVKGSKWLCLCQCGNERVLRTNYFTQSKVFTKSCGCANQIPCKTHGLSYTAEYTIWHDMKRRCYNENNKSYEYYGGRGIQVCERWKNSVENFVEDMGLRPGPEYSIDRKDVNGNYCKENCEWKTHQEQMNNTRMNKFITFNNETFTISEWSRKLGFRVGIIQHRLSCGWSIERTLTEPSKMDKYRKIEDNNGRL